jgi:DNA-binding GntR family transcriptional regulator
MSSDDAKSNDEKSVHCQHGERRQLIVELLLEDIVQGVIKAEERLVTQKLSLRYGVSHTPIREALITLGGIGIVNLEPNRGAIVRPITEYHIREITDFRSLLQCEAIKLACGKIGHIQLLGLKDRIERLKNVAGGMGVPAYQDAKHIDDELQDVIANCCGNSFLTKELHRLKLLFTTFRNVGIKLKIAQYDHRRLVEETEEYHQIVKSLISEDKKMAVKTMGLHIENVFYSWIETMAAVQSRPLTDTTVPPSQVI